MVSERTDRNIVYASFGICTDRFFCDSSRRFSFAFSVYKSNGCFCFFGCEIVNQDSVYVEIKNFLYFIEGAGFDFNFKIFAFRFEIFFRLCDCSCNATSVVNMIVFNSPSKGCS